MFGCCKTFFRKYIFSGNANFRKRKMFPCVWLHIKKFSGKYFLVFGKEEGKHKSRKTQATTQIQSGDKSSPTTAPSIAIFLSRRRRDLPLSPSPAGSSSLAYIRDLAIDASRDRAVDRDLDPVRSHDGEIAINGNWNVCRWDRDRRIVQALACARFLCLCKIFQKYFEGKIEV